MRLLTLTEKHRVALHIRENWKPASKLIAGRRGFMGTYANPEDDTEQVFVRVVKRRGTGEPYEIVFKRGQHQRPWGRLVAYATDKGLISLTK